MNHCFQAAAVQICRAGAGKSKSQPAAGLTLGSSLRQHVATTAAAAGRVRHRRQAGNTKISLSAIVRAPAAQNAPRGKEQV
ncbi:MAG: hypothetical protein M1571_00040 [Firmicutes bacterium]|nr:hypothetical protein [Bacillota bacterium]